MDPNESHYFPPNDTGNDVPASFSPSHDALSENMVKYTLPGSSRIPHSQPLPSSGEGWDPRNGYTYPVPSADLAAGTNDSQSWKGQMMPDWTRPEHEEAEVDVGLEAKVGSSVPASGELSDPYLGSRNSTTCSEVSGDMRRVEETGKSGKRSVGRPRLESHLDPTDAKERRRTQGRNAQRAYQQRKNDHVIRLTEDLETRTTQLSSALERIKYLESLCSYVGVPYDGWSLPESKNKI